ncbi:hypothetical protein KMZ29_10775 [Bradyrhizobium sediminis]|uniref:Uncharacterized protein n=1 Tax=Bradyrhizobium sediminis TaxID=2840469 RepID=A0A975NID7_9BRAD|nr:hypothetical protein [Bradyrhizobium sediminis]QWG15096.1 hypothetical protein KMZ29_10775 [Bradyrhizobium sediminis]
MPYDVESQIKRQILGRVKTGGILLGGLAILAAVSALFANPLRVFFRLIAVASMAMLILSIVTMVLTFRKAKAIEAVALLLSLAVIVIGTLVSLWFGGRPPPLSMSLAAGLAGVLQHGLGCGYSLCRSQPRAAGVDQDRQRYGIDAGGRKLRRQPVRAHFAIGIVPAVLRKRRHCRPGAF